MAQTKRSAKVSGKSKTILPDYPVVEFEGLNTYTKDITQLTDGQSPDSLNWITGRYKDNISIRRGSALLGKTRNSGSGRITGLGIANHPNGSQVPFFSHDQKVLYYDSVANDTIEAGNGSVPASLLAYYQMQGNSTDSVNAHNGVDTNITYSIANGKIGQGAGLDGTTSQIVITDSAALHPSQFSIVCWIKTTTTNIGTIFQVYSQNSNRAGFCLDINNVQINHAHMMSAKNTGTLLGTDYQQVFTSTAINDGNWHHIVASADGTNLYMYCDGVLQSTVPWAFNPIYAGTTYVQVGTRNNTGSSTNFFNGDIDELALWSVALNAYEVSQLYSSTSPYSTSTAFTFGANILPVAASGEDISFMPYENLAGNFIYATSPNSSIYKFVSTNPTSSTNLLSTNYRGTAKIGQNRMFMWNRNNSVNSKFPSQLSMGVFDKQTISQYTQTTAEDTSNTGDGVSKTFTGTLTYRSNNSKATTFFDEFAAPITVGISITGITAVTQAVVTVGAHTFKMNDAVIINGVSGMTQINNLFGVVQAVTSTTITLSINSSGFSAYTMGGDIYLAEYLFDDKNGNLTSTLGGTGSINYTTGAFTLNFNTAPLNGQKIFAQYYIEDSTSGGVADFTVDGATNGQGKVYSQNDGAGAIQGVFPFDQVEYIFHILKTWYLTVGTDDTKASNYPYRSSLGIPYFRGGYSTDDGIVFLDLSHPSLPKVQVLEIDNANATAVVTVVPAPLSDTLDLTQYGFTKVVIRRWGDYDIMACQATVNGVVSTINTQCFIRNIYSGLWDLLNYPISCLDEYLGMLLSGDSLSNNIFTLFSGFDDDGSLINNYWKSKQYNLGIQGLKTTGRFVVRGLIQQTQSIDVLASFDNGNFIKLFTIAGNGAYVNTGTPAEVGANTIGSQVIGGGGGTVTAYPFEIDYPIASDLYEYVQIQFQGTNIGYAQIDEFIFKDNRYKGRQILPANTIVL